MQLGKIVPDTSGVYAIRHASGAQYVGSSNNIRRRASFSRWQLRSGSHHSPDLQDLWSATDESEWSLVVLELTSVDSLVLREQYCMDGTQVLLNLVKSSGRAGHTWTEKSRQKASESRARYLDDPAARQALSERARQQHANGNLGQETWSEEVRVRAVEKVRAHNRDPALFLNRSEKAKKQHAEGKLGPATWK